MRFKPNKAIYRDDTHIWVIEEAAEDLCIPLNNQRNAANSGIPLFTETSTYYKDPEKDPLSKTGWALPTYFPPTSHGKTSWADYPLRTEVKCS